MSLPKQVQNQVEQLEAMEKELYGDQKPADLEKPAAEVVAPEAHQKTEQKAEEPKAEEPKEPAAEPAPAKEETSKKEDEDPAVWKQKYKTLQGMYDAEVPRLHAELKQMKAGIEKMQADAAKAKEEAAQAKQESLSNLVTDEDRQEFGEDLLEVQRKIAREVAAPLEAELDSLKAKNAELREQLDKTGTEVTTASFEQRLLRLVPDFDQVNTNPDWIAWLNTEDPILRGPRLVVAQKAYSEGDAQAIADYVKLFKDSIQPVETTKKAETELESQIQPSKEAASSQPTASPKGQTFNDAQIRSMFQKIATLNSTGRTEEARKLEAQIDAAFAEGRVVA